MRVQSQRGLFNWAFAQFAILQIVKTIKGLSTIECALSWKFPPLLTLLVSVCYILFWNPDHTKASICLFASFAILSLLDGSLSNHVVTSSALAVLALTCMYQPEPKLRGATTWFCAVLYLVTGIHKLNSGFFDPKHSCASLYVAGSFSILPHSMLKTFLPVFQPMVLAAPYCAVFFELAWPALILFSSGTLYKFAILIGSLFHAVLAFPPSPLYEPSMLYLHIHA
jgi:hypothetical protein